MTSPRATSTGRPPLGTPSVGDDVFVREGGTRHATTIPAKITAVGRVWLTIEHPDTRRQWRLRKDTQKGGRGIGYGTNFATPEQLAYDEKVLAAFKFLREQGIDVRYDSPWHEGDKAVVLAGLLRQADTDGDC